MSTLPERAAEAIMSGLYESDHYPHATCAAVWDGEKSDCAKNRQHFIDAITACMSPAERHAEELYKAASRYFSHGIESKLLEIVAQIDAEKEDKDHAR